MTAVASGWTTTEASVQIRRGSGGAVRVDGTLCTAPLWFRWDATTTTLWLVGSGASPVGEDHIKVRVEVGPDVSVRVRSVAATVIYAARGVGTRWETELTVADGARVDWRPEPVIVTNRARHAATTIVQASRDAAVTVDEVLVLGRAEEDPGVIQAALDVRVDDAPTLLTSLDTGLPGWVGPAGVDGASVIANRLCLGEKESVTIGRDARAVLLEPSLGCRLAVATASDVAAARQSLDATLPVNSIH